MSEGWRRQVIAGETSREGDEIDSRIATELAKLKIPPRETGVGMLRMAEIKG